MRKIITLFFAVLLFPSFIQLPAQTKRALVIGVGEQKDKSWAKIHGDNDVVYVLEVLERAGYPKKNIQTLVNKEATKEGIVAAFQDLTGRCQAGDIVYVHFSGHGQQVTDVSGDEEDGLDEAWIPYDAYLKYDTVHDKGEKHLLDDELNVLLSGIREKIGNEGALLVVVDACHSGDITSGINADGAERGALHVFEIPITERGHEGKRVEQWLTLSACKSSQTNRELKNPEAGSLTYAIYDISKKGDVTIGTVVEFVQRLNGTRMTPQLGGKEKVDYELSIFFK